MSPDAFTPAREILERAVEKRAFPSAVVEVGRRDTVLWTEAFGRLTYDPGARPASLATIFDLASLTKVLATATVAMRLVEAERLRLADPVGAWLAGWRGPDRDQVTIEDLLAHASGLTAYLPFFRDHSGRQEFEPAICALPLEYPPRSQSVYSDLGFILLGFLIEDAGGTSLSRQFEPIARLVTSEPLQYLPPRDWRDRIAPTERDVWRGRLLVGDVHDENAWALRGVAGHAGLFGTARGVGAFAQAILRSLAGEAPIARPETLRRFMTRSTVPASSRALAWDTMLPTSSCGHYLTASAVGHTGFTGTSLWIDPERDVYVVFLTNRVHPTRDNNAILTLRPMVHDAILSAI